MPNTSLAAYNRANMPLCITAATKQQKASPSDPFTFNRVMTHLLHGLCLISDYDVQFRKEARKTATGISYSVEVPCNKKIL